MSWNSIFPTRDGGSIGTGLENRMLDAVGGANTIRTKIQHLQDGGSVMLRTRNGMPEFTRISSPFNIPEIHSPYMESGQLEWTFPGELNPARLYPATWHFLDIDTGGLYLGGISTGSPYIGAQTNNPALVEGQESLAIGYPRNTDPVKDVATRAKYASATVMKKLVAGYFPSSLFSGRMRQFMQAQYGARETATPNMTVTVDGTSVGLIYTYKGSSVGLSHRSTGLLTGSDGTFWVITIAQTSEAATLTAYQIIQVSEEGKRFMDLYTAAETYIEELRSYLFAHSVIDTEHPIHVGTLSAIDGFTLAYGWKWNSLGLRASKVSHETVGSGSGDMRWRATTHHIDIGYVGGGVFSPSITSISGGEWTDGWGAFNIFAPAESDVAGRLECISIAMDTGNVKPKFDFSDVPVYGFYKDDVWTPVAMSRTVSTGPFGVPQNRTSGIYFELPEYETYPDSYNWGWHVANAPWSYERATISDAYTMDVSIGGAITQGEIRTGTFTMRSGETTDVGEMLARSANFVTRCYGGNNGAQPTENPPGYDQLAGVSLPWIGKYVAFDIGTYTHNYRYFTGSVANVWALVIPTGDAEAVYLPKHYYMTSTGTYTAYRLTEASKVNEYVYPTGEPGSGYYGVADTRYPPIKFTPWKDCSYNLGTNVSSEGIPFTDTTVACWNAVLDGVAGTPSSSYSGIFVVSKDYPFYDPGMSFSTSFGKRYAGSEVPPSPSSVVESHRFVGWA